MRSLYRLSPILTCRALFALAFLAWLGVAQSAHAQAPAAPTGLTGTGTNGGAILSWNTVSGATGYNLYRLAIRETRQRQPAHVARIHGQRADQWATYNYYVTALSAGGESAASSTASATPAGAAPPSPVALFQINAGGPAVAPLRRRRGLQRRQHDQLPDGHHHHHRPNAAPQDRLPDQPGRHVLLLHPAGPDARRRVHAAAALRRALARRRRAGRFARRGPALDEHHGQRHTGADQAGRVHGGGGRGHGAGGERADDGQRQRPDRGGVRHGRQQPGPERLRLRAGGAGDAARRAHRPGGHGRQHERGAVLECRQRRDGYNVYRSAASGGPLHQNHAEPVTWTSYPDTGLTNGTTAYYVVTALTAGGEGGSSNEASATPTVAFGLGLSPSSVTGGASSTGTVTLSSPAPSGGTTVSLASNSAAATVPMSVTIPAGSSSATFTVGTTAVSSATAATISAAAGGNTKTAVLTVNPAILSSIGLNPMSVTGGAASTGTIALNGPAPTGGSIVTLTSSSASATVPSSITVLAGSRSATFTVNTSSVSAATTANISAAYGGVTQTVMLTVNPATGMPRFKITNISNGDVLSGDTSLTLLCTVVI